MSARFGLLSLWVLSLVPLAPAADSGHALSLDELKKEARFPSWAKSVKATPRAGQPWRITGRSRRSAAAMKRTVGRLRYVIDKHKRSSDRPLYMYQLGRHLADLEQDRLAYQALQDLIALPAGTPHNRKLHGMPTLDSVKRLGRLLLARILARNGLKDQTVAELKAAPPGNGYGRLRHAEAMVLLGDGEAAAKLLAQAHGGGHPNRGFSDVFIRMRAMVLARSMGRYDLALKIAQPILKRSLTSQKWPQWRAAWSIMNTTAGNIKAIKAAKAGELRDGAYRGECRGFVGAVRVRVQVREGRINSVQRTRCKDDRPWSAATVMPKRIARKGTLQVDAVTGATVTSCAVIAATDNALTKAVK